MRFLGAVGFGLRERSARLLRHWKCRSRIALVRSLGLGHHCYYQDLATLQLKASEAIHFVSLWVATPVFRQSPRSGAKAREAQGSGGENSTVVGNPATRLVSWATPGALLSGYLLRVEVVASPSLTLTHLRKL